MKRFTDVLIAIIFLSTTGYATRAAAASPVNGALPDLTFATSATATGSVADVSISIDNGSEELETGGLVTYEIVAASSGPSSVSATVEVDFPFGLAACTWTCNAAGGATCADSGTGNIGESIYLPTPAGGPVSATFTASCFVSTSVAIPPPATLEVPAIIGTSAFDPDLDNNTASDTDFLIPVVDVAVSIDDGVDTVWYGHVLSYQIGVFSTGSDAVVRVVNSLPSTLTNCNWTCQSLIGNSCPAPASGSGGIDVQLTLPAWSGNRPEFVRFTSTCTVLNTSSIDVVNTAQLQLAPPFRDSNSGDNQASDTDIIRRSVDLSATLSDGLQYVHVGDSLDYMIHIGNAGPDSAEFTYVSDTLPSGVSEGIWSCTASAGASCNEGVGDTLSDVATIPVGGHVTYLFSGVVQDQQFTAPIANTVSAHSDLESFDPTPGNNIANDTPPDIVVLFRDDFDLD